MHSWPLTTVISGGQTGADQAGLRAAKAEGYATGGLVPKGCRTDDGPAPWLVTEYGCRESFHRDYAHRTRWNANTGDGTVWFGKRGSAGHHVTKTACEGSRKPFVEFGGPLCESVNDLAFWIVRYRVRTLNVAGNRERTNPGIGESTEKILRQVLRERGLPRIG